MKPRPRRESRSAQNVVFVVTLWSALMIALASVACVLLANVMECGLYTLWHTATDRETVFALRLSVVTSTVTTFLCMATGIPIAYVLSRRKLPVPRMIDTIIDLPLVMPPLIIGMSLLVLFQSRPGIFLQDHVFEITYTARAIVPAQFFIAAPFAIRALKAAFDNVPPRYENIARTLGASEPGAFLTVTLPMARSGIIAAAVMTWARAIGEFGPVMFFAGAIRWKTETLPIAMFLRCSVGELKQTAALAIIMISLSITTLICFKKLSSADYLW